MSENDRSLASAFLSVLSGEVGALLVGLLVTPVIVRLLGGDGYGEYAFALSVVSVSLVVVIGGISDGMRKFLPERSGRARDDLFAFYARTAALVAVLVCVVGLGVTRLDPLAPLLPATVSEYATLIVLLVVARQGFQTVRGALMGVGLEHYSEPLTVVQQVVFGVAGVGLLAFGWGVTGLLVGHLTATLVVGLVATAVLASRIDLWSVFRATPDTLEKRDLLTFNGLSVVLTLLMTSLYHVDILLLRPLAGSRATGYYRAALLLAEFVWFVPFALQMALVQSTAAQWAEGRLDVITDTAARATRYTLALTILVAIGIGSLASAFVPLYFGREFLSASEATLLLLPGAVGFAVSRPILAIGQASGRLRPLVTATAVAAGVNLVLNLLLIPRYGLSGAAVATSLSYGSMLGLHLVVARRLGFDPLSDLRLGRMLLTTAGTTPVVVGLASWLDPTLALGVVPPVGGLLYGFLAVRTGVVTGEELAESLTQLPPTVAQPITRFVSWAES